MAARRWTRPSSCPSSPVRYSVRDTRNAHLRGRGIEAIIAEPNDQKRHRLRRVSRGGRPVGFDAERAKARNVVERSFATLKPWRGLATRYNKLALTYRAEVALSAVCIWLRSLTKSETLSRPPRAPTGGSAEPDAIPAGRRTGWRRCR
ncbi:hypothetical protein ERC79_08615 [Rhodococcus sp. ABRD24]|uniref:transposase n=1 Tax=Rhodococcus sp. ABRD24 TaxID=2507582 RepID=UPI00103F6720|nr:transposase [Rhodococcus sp. ABRD24]QBJ96026.1 hypothetical protein ERC79_08615 [Rhodococcus sp. ABRD24]